jgi:hypothetical protein
MSAVSKILRRGDPDGTSLFFWCPGYDHSHRVQIGQGPGPRWDWNGDVDKPTFTPSVLVTWNEPSDTAGEGADESKDVQKRCHTFVAGGVIDFLGDCTHALRGKHPIPDWPKPIYGGTVPLERS